MYMKNNKVKIRCNMVAVGDTVEEALGRTIAQLADMLDAAKDATIASEYHRKYVESEGEVDYCPYWTKFAKDGSRKGRAVSRAVMHLSNREDAECEIG